MSDHDLGWLQNFVDGRIAEASRITGVVPNTPINGVTYDKWGHAVFAQEGGIGMTAHAVTGDVQEIPDSSNEIIDFDSVLYDPLATITTGVSWKFTAPANGYYLVLSSGEMEAATWTGDLLSVDLTNITGFSGANIDFQYPSGTSIDVHWHGHGVLYFTAGDEGFIGIRQETGGDLNLQADASIIILRVS